MEVWNIHGRASDGNQVQSNLDILQIKLNVNLCCRTIPLILHIICIDWLLHQSNNYLICIEISMKSGIISKHLAMYCAVWQITSCLNKHLSTSAISTVNLD